MSMPIIIDGKRYAQTVKDHVKKWISRDLSCTPRLAIITFGEDDASKVYVRNKLKAAAEVGIEAKNFRFTFDEYCNGTFDEDFEHICKVSDGIILQLPVPSWVNESDIINKIPPEKDVDGLGTVQKGRLASHPLDAYIPCTPAGILELLGEYVDMNSYRGKHAVIIGRSQLVGKPLATLLLEEDLTVTVCHSKTENLKKYTQDADILITAAGKCNLITKDMVKKGAVVIDVSINRDENGNLCGDVDFENVAPKCAAITPVPGGVGPMTVAMLMFNTYLAAKDKEYYHWDGKIKKEITE